MKVLVFFLLFTCITFTTIRSASARDTISPTQPLTHNQTLVSSAQRFELGFFRPGNSANWYLGIWFKNISPRTVVWVANREHPIANASGVAKLINGNLVVAADERSKSMWSSSNHSQVVGNPIAQLLDTGNLVIRDENSNEPTSYLWQSFDDPGDTLLPGARFGWNLRTGLNRQLTSWRSSDDPSRGSFSYGLELQGFADTFLRNGRDKTYRSGPWNGIRFSGDSYLMENPGFKATFVSNDEEVYFVFDNKRTSVVSRFVLDPQGKLARYLWLNKSHEWVVRAALQANECSNYGRCGVYGICNMSNAIVCDCLKGFVPNSPQQWDSLDWTSGCRRRTRLDCEKGDRFWKLTSVKLPEALDSWMVSSTMTLEKCRIECLKNCSCKAYANSDIRNGGSGCILWFGDLLDIVSLNNEGSQDLHVRLAASELETDMDVKKEKRVRLVVPVSVALLGILLFGSIIWCIILRKKRGKRDIGHQVHEDEPQTRELELPLFDFVTVATATSNFSIDNKLGQGGFGLVYKGKLSTGQEIAVKRLSENSRQGLNEFKNEVLLIAKLQHFNLVRLLGCCIQRNEKMLIYEYMPNNSLDSFIFDHTKRRLLVWQKRFNIIVGIAQGLLYLHRDSRLRIIHRDLKASNILLDDELNPKISDFGLARTFGRDQTQANTGTVAGTYGYMPPEYAIDGLFSMKSDVFSFGVLVLEIVSGKENRGFDYPDHGLNLLGHAWNLWNEGKAIELVDPVMEEAATEAEVLRCIQVGLLCVQQHPEDRLTMASVVLMLSSDSVAMPKPNIPGFYFERNLPERGSSSTGKMFSYENESCVSMLLEGR